MSSPGLCHCGSATWQAVMTEASAEMGCGLRVILLSVDMRHAGFAAQKCSCKDACARLGCRHCLWCLNDVGRSCTSLCVWSDRGGNAQALKDVPV